ncbi:hypothetical protein [Dyella caseinilytica]|uniref:Uncharacterized protein n=1 Tax=Dyella caseinilytica TaxID=1849581 RepID=A0ABX7GXR9_9GAMM|nr:hypothetical protein [Dyella caseinilytica]QRN55251.1 hypothetical protein ISN74_07950 [Dyella caseinilytica]GGA00433.1 hypothetical protein GCM10011408_21690 [Dyella caseinilytica]
MPWTNPTAPNLTDFITFCQGQGVTTVVLNPDSDYFQWSFNQAFVTCPYVPQVPSNIYVSAVYNLGLHLLIEMAQDQTGLAITSMVWANGLVTVTAAAATGYNAGQQFDAQIVGTAPAIYNGCFCMTVTGAETFTYQIESNPGAVTAVGMFNMLFFASARKAFELNQLVAGPVQSTGDQGTDTTLAVADFWKTLTLEDLDLIKTKWGRAYLSYAQKAGPTVVGIS